MVIGSSNTDMVFRVSRFPLPGETLLGGEFRVIPGGKGANQAVAAARAGAEVVFVAKVGDDDLGKQAIAGYHRDGIDIRFILNEKEMPSGVAMILVEDGSGKNSIVVASGANACLRPADMDHLAFEIQSADVLLIQLEIPVETVQRALELAAITGVTTILNPAPAQTVSEELLHLVDFITPNETETQLLTGILPDREDATIAAARKLLQPVREAAIITLGEQGAFYLDKTGQSINIPALRVTAVDSTAAGDVFNGYLAAALAGQMSPVDAIELANKAAALSVTRHGAQPSIPKWDEL